MTVIPNSLFSTDFSQLKLPETEFRETEVLLQRFLPDMESDRSSFFHLPQFPLPAFPKLPPQQTSFLHLGIGGSSLGAEAIVRALAPSQASRFYFLDNIDPDYLQSVLSTVSPEKTVVYVVSKSGTTMETLAQFCVIYDWLSKGIGEGRARGRIYFCTDPEKGLLRKIARDWNAPCFNIPPNLGGRFSALSAVGLFPAACAGINFFDLVQGAKVQRNIFLNDVKSKRVPKAVDLAMRLSDHYLKNKRNITVFMPYSQLLKTVSAWFTQLWAESLGKDGKGITPLAAVGPTDQHSILQLLRDGPDDKVVGFMEIDEFENSTPVYGKYFPTGYPELEFLKPITLPQLLREELNATRQVHVNRGRPHFSLKLKKLSAQGLGEVLFFLETVTAVAGYILGVDPFDQPGVEEGKKLTLAALQKKRS